MTIRLSASVLAPLQTAVSVSVPARVAYQCNFNIL